MFILNTHNHRLIFRINNDVPNSCMKRWKKLKIDCENGDNKYIVEKMKTCCKLEQNKNIPYLQRAEGGIGGDNNFINKQIRFFTFFSHIFIPVNYNNKDIVLEQITNTDIEKWTYEELDDLINAFTKTFNYFIESDYFIRGVIEMSTNSNLDSDNEESNLDSDNEESNLHSDNEESNLDSDNEESNLDSDIEESNLHSDNEENN